MKKFIIAILIIALAVGVYLFFTEEGVQEEESPIKESEGIEKVDNPKKQTTTFQPEEDKIEASWINYENEFMRFSFSYPDTGGRKLEHRGINTNFPSLDQGISGDNTTYIKAFSPDTWGDVSDRYNNSCEDIFVPIYGKTDLNNSCEVFISDADVKIMTGFFRNRHGEPPFVATFHSGNQKVLLIQFYPVEFRDVLMNNPEIDRFGATDDFVARIQSGEFPEISKKVEDFKEILKTIEVK